MKTIMARSPHETSFSFSRRFLNWRKKVGEDEDNDEEILTVSDSSTFHSFSGPTSLEDKRRLEFFTSSVAQTNMTSSQSLSVPTQKKKKKDKPTSKLKSALALFSSKPRSSSHLSSPSLGSKVIGTLFGYRRAQVHIAFQDCPNSPPAFLIQISTPTSVLVREMASGLVRVALECDKKVEKIKGNGGSGLKLLEEPLWRAYCNGKKCGYATRRECGPEELRILRAVGPVSMGAGVLPAAGRDVEEDVGVGPEGELMYMRARFERVVGSKDSEAFYMMNPDGNGGPELSVYLLRV